MPLPDESRAAKARDLIARFQSNIDVTGDSAPLKPRHSFGSNEVWPDSASTSRDVSPGNTRRPSTDVLGAATAASAMERTRSGQSPSPNPTWLKPGTSATIMDNTGTPMVAFSEGGKAVNRDSNVTSTLSMDMSTSSNTVSLDQSADVTVAARTNQNTDSSINKKATTLSSTPRKDQVPSKSPSAQTPAVDKRESAPVAVPITRTPANAFPSITTPTKPDTSQPSSATKAMRTTQTPSATNTSATRARREASQTSATSSTTSPVRPRKVVSPSPPHTASTSAAFSRLTRPTAASASKARASIGGYGESPTSARPTSALSSSMSPSTARVARSMTPGRTTPRQSTSTTGSETPAVIRARKQSTTSVGRSPLASSVRETSRATPTKMAKSPSPVPPASTPARSHTTTSPSGAGTFARLSRPTVSSLAHARHEDETARTPPQRNGSSASTPSSTKASAGMNANSRVVSSSRGTIGERMPGTRGPAGSPLTGVRPKIGVVKSVNTPPKKLLLAGKSDNKAMAKAKSGDGDRDRDNNGEKEEQIQREVDVIPEVQLAPETDQVAEEDTTNTSISVQPDADDGQAEVVAVPAQDDIPDIELDHAGTYTAEYDEGVQDTSASGPSDISAPALSSAPTSASSVADSLSADLPSTHDGQDTTDNLVQATAGLSIASGESHGQLSPRIHVKEEEEDFAEKWGTRSGNSPLPSPGMQHSRSQSPHAPSISPGAEGAAVKRVPIWMRKGGESEAG